VKTISDPASTRAKSAAGSKIGVDAVLDHLDALGAGALAEQLASASLTNRLASARAATAPS
jgi:hypothetical protein